MIERDIYYSPNLYLGEYYLAHGEQFGFSREALDWTAKLLPTRTDVFRRAAVFGVARKGWLEKKDLLNTSTPAQVRKFFYDRKKKRGLG